MLAYGLLLSILIVFAAWNIIEGNTFMKVCNWHDEAIKSCNCETGKLVNTNLVNNTNLFKCKYVTSETDETCVCEDTTSVLPESTPGQASIDSCIPSPDPANKDNYDSKYTMSDGGLISTEDITKTYSNNNNNKFKVDNIGVLYDYTGSKALFCTPVNLNTKNYIKDGLISCPDGGLRYQTRSDDTSIKGCVDAYESKDKTLKHVGKCCPFVNPKLGPVSKSPELIYWSNEKLGSDISFNNDIPTECRLTSPFINPVSQPIPRTDKFVGFLQNIMSQFLS